MCFNFNSHVDRINVIQPKIVAQTVELLKGRKYIFHVTCLSNFHKVKSVRYGLNLRQEAKGIFEIKALISYSLMQKIGDSGCYQVKISLRLVILLKVFLFHHNSSILTRCLL